MLLKSTNSSLQRQLAAAKIIIIFTTVLYIHSESVILGEFDKGECEILIQSSPLLQNPAVCTSVLL